MEKLNIVELTDKQMILVWSIVAWFQVSPLATSSLVVKFYPDLPNKQYKYDTLIEDRIIDVADSIKSLREKKAFSDSHPKKVSDD